MLLPADFSSAHVGTTPSTLVQPDREVSHHTPQHNQIRLSEIIAALSYALDLTEGQPEGHAVRTCLIGMRIAHELRLPAAMCSALFYALLLKDLGCSLTAPRLSSLFGEDGRISKRVLRLLDWSHMPSGAAQALHQHTAESTKPQNFHAVHREIAEMRCNRGAHIARMLRFSEMTAEAIATIDEHWDGRNSPLGLQGEQIPLLGRIAALAQAVEMCFRIGGLYTAYEIAEQRCGTWFDPELVAVLRRFQHEPSFWREIDTENAPILLADYVPEDGIQVVDDTLLDRIAEAFALVIDSKSSWTYRHSTGVAEIAVGIAQVLGFTETDLRNLRRAALLHDIGKLAIPAALLDKHTSLTDAEYAVMRSHTEFTRRILERVECFRPLATVASAHHERLDGSGYHLGLTAEQLGLPERVLAVADVCEALLAARPYRAGYAPNEVLAIIQRDAGTKLCSTAVAALGIYFEQRYGRPPEMALSYGA